MSDLVMYLVGYPIFGLCFLLFMMMVDPLVGLKVVELIDWLSTKVTKKPADKT